MAEDLAPAVEDAVNVINPDGQLVSIPATQLPDALENGYGHATPDDIAKFQRTEKFGTTGQQALTGLEGAASAATFGLSTGLEKEAGEKFGIENFKSKAIQARREENQGPHALGQVTGLVGSALLAPEVGAAKLMSGAGEAVAGALGLGAKGAGILSRVGASGVKAAVENALFQSGDEVSKLFSSNTPPSEAVGTAIANIGLSSLIGGGIGVGMGAVSPLWEATAGKKLNGILQSVTNEAEGTGAASAVNPQAFQANMAMEQLGKIKPNANEIAQAGSNLGIKLPGTVFSDAEFIQRMSSNLSKRGTIFGNKFGAEITEAHKGLSKAAQETLRDATLKTEAEVGREIKEGLSKKLETQLKPIEESYNELKPHLQNMGISDELKQGAVQNLLSNEAVTASATSEAANVASKIGEEIQNLKTVDQLKSYRTLLNARIRKVQIGGGEELPVLYAAKNELNTLREAAITDAAKRTGIGKEAGVISQDTINQLKQTDVSYREYKQKLMDLGREAGLGKLGSARQLLDKFKGLSDEALASKIFDLNDINQMNFVKKNFPEQFELARRFKLKEIAEKATDEGLGKNAKFNVGKYLQQLSDQKLNPEARNLLMGPNASKLQDIRTIYQNLPENFNPSGTAAEHSFGHMFSPQGVVDNLSDAVKYAVLKGLPDAMAATGSTDSKAVGLGLMSFLSSGKAPEGTAFKAMVDFISKTIKGDNMIQDATQNLFKAGREVIPSKALPDEKKRQKLDKRLQALKVDPVPLFNSGGSTAHYMPDHGTAMGMIAGTAVQYLNELRPNQDRQNPLDSERPVNAQAKSRYENALDVAEQPLVVLDQIKSGTLNSETLGHLKAMYPDLYGKLQQQVMNNMAESMHKEEPIPYKMRLGLSLFLGQPLDSTMVPASILAAQAVAPIAPPSEQQQSQPPKRHNMDGIQKFPQSVMTPGQARQQARSASRG